MYIKSATLMVFLLLGGVFSSCTTETPAPVSPSPARLDSFTVLFESNGGTAVDSQRVERGKLATQPVPPTKTDSLFSGWYSDASLSTVFQFSTPITARITLYAKWVNAQTAITVTFESNGGSVLPAQSITQGDTVAQPQNPTKRDSIFSGWYSDAGLSTVFRFNMPITQNTTLYAKWEYDPYVTIPDSNFRKALQALIPQAFNTEGRMNKLHDSVAKKIILDVGSSDIASLGGIEYFTGLTTLYCNSNQLTVLDVGKNTALTILYCSSNQLTALDVSGNLALTTLNCVANQLSALDVSRHTALTELDCNNNQLASLDVSGNTALTILDCSSNQLTALDVSGSMALTELYCYSNQLTALDVSGSTALTQLYCYSNRLTALDVSRNTALTELYCYSNQLTALDVSRNTALIELLCYSNQLTSLDISGMPRINRNSDFDGFSGTASALSLAVNKAIEMDSKITALKTKYDTKLSVTVR